MRIKELVGEGRLDPIRSISIPLLPRVPTEVFRRHPECFDEETTRTFTSSGDLFRLTLYPLCLFAGRQQAIEPYEGPLCHHFRLRHVRRRSRRASSQTRDSRRSERDRLRGLSSRTYSREETCRRMGCRPIFGVPTPRRAQIVKFNGLSAHADRQDLLAYVRAIKPSPSKVFLVHKKSKRYHWLRPFRRNIPRLRSLFPMPDRP